MYFLEVSIVRANGRGGMIKRSKGEIICDILETCRRGACKTEVVRLTNMNFNTTTSYLGVLVDKGLLQIKERHRIMYQTTSKGYKFVKNYNRIQDDFFS